MGTAEMVGPASRSIPATGTLRPMLIVPNTTSGVAVYCEHMIDHAARTTVEGVKSSTRQGMLAIVCEIAEVAFGWNVTDGRAGNWGASRYSNWLFQNVASSSVS